MIKYRKITYISLVTDRYIEKTDIYSADTIHTCRYIDIGDIFGISTHL